MPPRSRPATPTHCDCQSVTHTHGTDIMYITHKCGCDDCRHAHTATRRKARRTAYQDGRLVESAATRKHLEALTLGQGYSLTQVAEMSGVSLMTLYNLRTGRHRHCSSTIHDAITGIRPRRAPEGRIDATGAMRRLQALTVLGHSMATVSDVCGVNRWLLRQICRGDKATINVATHESVKRAYDAMWATPAPEDTREQRTSASKAKEQAARNGWLPPLAWDDDRIDDPKYRPRTPAREEMAA